MVGEVRGGDRRVRGGRRADRIRAVEAHRRRGERDAPVAPPGPRPADRSTAAAPVAPTPVDLQPGVVSDAVLHPAATPAGERRRRARLTVRIAARTARRHDHPTPTRADHARRRRRIPRQTDRAPSSGRWPGKSGAVTLRFETAGIRHLRDQRREGRVGVDRWRWTSRLGTRWRWMRPGDAQPFEQFVLDTEPVIDRYR